MTSRRDNIIQQHGLDRLDQQAAIDKVLTLNAD